MSIISILELSLKTDVLDEATAHLKEILTQTRAFPGCESIEVLVDVNDPTRVVIIERWASAADDAAYRAWRKTPEGASNLGSYVATAPSLTMHAPHPSI